MATERGLGPFPGYALSVLGIRKGAWAGVSAQRETATQLLSTHTPVSTAARDRIVV